MHSFPTHGLSKSSFSMFRAPLDSLDTQHIYLGWNIENVYSWVWEFQGHPFNIDYGSLNRQQTFLTMTEQISVVNEKIPDGQLWRLLDLWRVRWQPLLCLRFGSKWYRRGLTAGLPLQLSETHCKASELTKGQGFTLLWEKFWVGEGCTRLTGRRRIYEWTSCGDSVARQTVSRIK